MSYSNLARLQIEIVPGSIEIQVIHMAIQFIQKPIANSVKRGSKSVRLPAFPSCHLLWAFSGAPGSSPCSSLFCATVISCVSGVLCHVMCVRCWWWHTAGANLQLGELDKSSATEALRWCVHQWSRRASAVWSTQLLRLACLVCSGFVLLFELVLSLPCRRDLGSLLPVGLFGCVLLSGWFWGQWLDSLLVVFC